MGQGGTSHELDYRSLQALNVTRKTLSRKHIRKDLGAQVEYLDRICFVSASRIWDMDGIAFNPKDTYEKFGWTEKGHGAVRFEITLCGRNFATHAVGCEDGIVAYEIQSHDVTRFGVAGFIERRVAPAMPSDTILFWIMQPINKIRLYKHV